MGWILDLELKNLAQTVGTVAALLAALAYLWTKWIGPFLARPIGRTIGRAIRAELRELVEEIVTGLTKDLLRRVADQERRTGTLERELNDLANRVNDHHRKPHQFTG